MAKSILDIVIRMSKEGGADKDTVRGLVDIKSAALNGIATFGAFAGAAYGLEKGFEDLTNGFLTYADQVRSLSSISGQGAEETSRFLQVLDDFKLTSEDAEAATKKLTANGLVPNIDTLAKLSDQYLALNNTEDKNKLILDNLGKSGLQWVEVLNQGSAAIKARAAAVDQSLILDEASLQSARVYEFELDDLKDKIEGVKLAAGKGIIGLITGETADVQKRSQEIFQIANGYAFNTNQLGRYSDAQRASWQQAQMQAEQEWAVAHGMDAAAAATGDYGQTAEEAAAQAKALTQQFNDQLGLIGKIQSANDSYEQSASDLAKERTQIESDRATAIAQGWWTGSQKIKDYDAALAENSQKADENAAKQHEAMMKIQFDLLVTKLSVDGITDAEYGLIEQAGLTFGVFDAASLQSAKNMDQVTQAVANGQIKLKDTQAILDLMAQGYSIDVAIKISGQEALQNLQNQLGGEQGKKVTVGQTKRAAGGLAGGFTWVGERGPELVNLPGGSYVYPAGESARIAAGNSIIVNINVNSAVSIMDEAKARQVLTPMIIEGVKRAQANGVIK